MLGGSAGLDGFFSPVSGWIGQEEGLDEAGDGAGAGETGACRAKALEPQLVGGYCAVIEGARK